MHVHQNGDIKCLVPASGLVTSLEPILRACDGTWVANGAGDADREMVDEHDRLRVPPDEPHYTLRRVWLSEEEEKGYYLGFANEGLWPLCHIAHTRPTFREADWKQYKAVNQKFAEAVLQEMEGTQEPAVLIHDYHFALLPRMVKEKRPDARVAIFWHIPWPNPEAFGILPWREELLEGLLGAASAGGADTSKLFSRRIRQLVIVVRSQPASSCLHGIAESSWFVASLPSFRSTQ